MPQGNRPGDQRRADATAARAKGVTTRAVGTTRGETTGGSRSNVRGGMSPVGSSQPPSMGLSQSAINNASFIDYRRTPGDTARETLDLARLASPSFNQRLDTYHKRLGEIDNRHVRDMFSSDANDIVNGHAFGKRPPVIKGTQNTTSPKSAPDIRAGRELRKLASDTRTGHRPSRGQNVGLDEFNNQNVRNANNTARMHEDSAKLMAGAHANEYYGNQTDRMREMTGNKRQTGNNVTNVDNYDGVAPSDSHRQQPGPATKESVARDLGNYAMRPLGKEFVDAGTKRPSGMHVSEAPPKSIGSQFKMNAPGLAKAGLAGLGAGVAVAGALNAQRIGSEALQNHRRDKAEDMGPVKGRMLTQENRFAGGEPRQSGKTHSSGTRVVGK